MKTKASRRHKRPAFSAARDVPGSKNSVNASKASKASNKASKASSKSPRQVDDKNAEPSLQHACLKGSQFTCFTGTKVLALLVQKKDDDTSAEHSLQQTSRKEAAMVYGALSY
jgi:hypothetical protein